VRWVTLFPGLAGESLERALSGRPQRHRDSQALKSFFRVLSEPKLLPLVSHFASAPCTGTSVAWSSSPMAELDSKFDRLRGERR